MAFRQVITINSVENTDSGNAISFRWTYIVLPLALLLIAVVLAAIFYGMLPEQVKHHFKDGIPQKSLERGLIIAWLVVPHVICVLVAFLMVRIAMFASRNFSPEDTPVVSIIPLMGNMIALIQVILVYAALDIFLYNANGIKLIPVWVIIIIVLVLGGIILSAFFARTMRRYSKVRNESTRE